jgi:hypothetical protein
VSPSSSDTNQSIDLRPVAERLAGVASGTPRLEFLAHAGLTEEAGATRTTYFATLCGSIEEWTTANGERYYVQGHFFDSDGYRDEPYIIAVKRYLGEAEHPGEVVWSGLNLQTGEDIFVPVAKQEK